VITPVSVKDEKQMSIARKIYDDLNNAGVDVLLDDRDERPGVKFKDADLIGIPFRMTIGKSIEKGEIELFKRSDKTIKMIPIDSAAKIFKEQL